MLRLTSVPAVNPERAARPYNRVPYPREGAKCAQYHRNSHPKLSPIDELDEITEHDVDLYWLEDIP